MIGPTLDFIKNGDGVYELPLPNALPPGPKMLLLEKPKHQPGSIIVDDYIKFVDKQGRSIYTLTEPIKSGKKKGCAKEKKKRKEITRQDIEGWLITATRQAARRDDTALSFAFGLACEKKLGPTGRKLVLDIAKKEAARIKSKVIVALAAANLELERLQLKPLRTELELAKERGWVWCADRNYYIRATPLDEGTNRIVAGQSMKYGPSHYANRRRAKADPYGLANEGGVHCG